VTARPRLRDEKRAVGREIKTARVVQAGSDNLPVGRLDGGRKQDAGQSEEKPGTCGAYATRAAHGFDSRRGKGDAGSDSGSNHGMRGICIWLLVTRIRTVETDRTGAWNQGVLSVKGYP